MACLTTLTSAEAERVASEYGLQLESFEPVEAGSVNSNFRFACDTGAVFGRIYEEQGMAGAEAELRLLSELAADGVPVAAPLRRVDGGVASSVRGKPFGLYPWVDGEWLCHQRLTLAHCRVLGAALARVHLATPRLSCLPAGRFGLPQIRERLAFIRERAPQFEPTLTSIEHGLSQYELQRNPNLPRGLIHGDLFRDNVLWQLDAPNDNPRVAALLDFESASAGVFAYDVMVCVLSWCFTDALQGARVHALLDGYESLRPLSPLEREATTIEGMAVCLRFATTRITDFAMRTPPGQRPKRDFARFLERHSALRNGAMRRVWQERVAV